MAFSFSSAGAAASGGSDVLLYRDGPGELALRNGVNAQRFNVYETYTDASNYERGFIQSSGSGYFQVGTEAAGTGVAQILSFFQNGAERVRIAGNFINVFKTITPLTTGVALGRPNYTFTDAYIDEVYSYNSYTDASNYELGALKWDTNRFTIDTEALGTGGVARDIALEPGTGTVEVFSTTTTSYLAIGTTNTGRGASNGLTVGYNESVGGVIQVREAESLTFGTSDSGRWRITTGGDFQPVTNGSFDIGASSLRVLDYFGETINLKSSANSVLVIENDQTPADGVDTGIAFNMATADYSGGIKSAFRGGTANANKDLEFYAGGDSSTPRFSIAGNNLVYQRNGTNAQTFEIYNTYTDASNYERIQVGHE
jgi:hypothetical protein